MENQLARLRKGGSLMATISFTKEFSVNRRNANNFSKALSSSRRVNFVNSIKAADVKKSSILSFFEGIK
ncbi:MAG: hypothetical protein H6Q70_3954 [Firmicutes bacterium]|nr:hypothetical protein [Bacillota bacterium]